jgi:hypothetical protein
MLGEVPQNQQQQARVSLRGHTKFHFNYPLCSKNPASSDADASDTRSSDFQSYLSMHGADLQAALDKHWNNILRLLQMGTTAVQIMIPKKCLPRSAKQI